MAAPSVIIRENDISTRVPSFPGVYEGIVIKATKGQLDRPRLVTSENDLLKYFTPDEKIEMGMDLGYFSALAALEKTNKLWVVRAANNPRYGAFYFHKDGTITQVKQKGQPKPIVSFKVSNILEGKDKVTITDLSVGTLDDLVDREIIIDKVGKFTIKSVSGNIVTLDRAVTAQTTLPTSVNKKWEKVEKTVDCTFDYKDVNAADSKLTIHNLVSKTADETAVVDDIKVGYQFTLNAEDGIKHKVTAVEKVGTDLKITIDGNTTLTGVPTTGTGKISFVRVKRPEIDATFTEFVDGETTLKVTLNKATITDLKLLELNLEDKGLEKYTITNVDTGTSTVTLDKAIDNKSLVNNSTGTATAIKLEAESLVDPTAEAMDDTVLFMIYGANPGKWNNDVRVRIQTNYTSKRTVQKVDRYGSPLYLDDHDVETTTPTLKPVMIQQDTEYTPVKEPDAFLIQVFKSSNLVIPVEEFTVSRDQMARNGYGENMFIEDQVNKSNYIRVVNNASVPADTPIVTMNKSAYDYASMPLHGTPYDFGSTNGYFGFMVGGDDGLPVTDSNMILAAQKFRSKISYLLTVLLDGGWSTPAYQKELIKIAEERKDCVAILSTPYSAENAFDYKNAIGDYIKFRLNANTSYAALYGPHVKIVDKFNNREIWVAPDGYAGGAISATASNYELWYPVGGFKRGMLNVIDTKIRFEQGELDYLYDMGLNPIRFYPGKGIMIWGQKTLTTRPSALDRLNVRLMLITIEPAIGEALESFLFELNDSSTRALAKFIVTSYMEGIKARKGVSDFLVVCDDTNNTAEDIDNYKMNLDLYVKPMRGIDWIVFTTVITRTGMSFSTAQSTIRS